jgi:hypothetical protein
MAESDTIIHRARRGRKMQVRRSRPGCPAKDRGRFRQSRCLEAEKYRPTDFLGDLSEIMSLLTGMMNVLSFLLTLRQAQGDT